MRVLTFISMVVFFVVAKPHQVVAQFAFLDSLEHTCNGAETGYIGFVLYGDPANYSYVWEDGATTLVRKNLPAGVYTLFIRNQFGCEEEYEVEILDINGCIMKYGVDYDGKCEARIIIEVSSNGVPIPEEAIDVEWADGSSAGLIRYVQLRSLGVTCLDVVISVGNGCCILEETICLDPPSNCYVGPWIGPIKDVIVNEIKRDKEDGRQFVELLVLGTGMCGDSVDLTGFIVDDNNGYIIKGNSTLAQHEAVSLGVDKGYIIFAKVNSWRSVPNGSLIVLYDPNSDMGVDFPADDPEDSDGDGVYVLSVENTSYLTARQGEWQYYNNEYAYSGSLMYPSWDLINIDAVADGIQVRFPDGTFCHGISSGKVNLSANEQFDLWLSEDSLANRNWSWVGNDFRNKDHFEQKLSEEELYSPGVANSDTNALIINYLRDCSASRGGIEGNDFYAENVGRTKNTLTNDLKAYPNPFKDKLFLELFSGHFGQGKIKAFGLSGKLIWTQNLSIKKGRHQHALNLDQYYSSGMIILEVEFPDGEHRYLKVARIK